MAKNAGLSFIFFSNFKTGISLGFSSQPSITVLQTNLICIYLVFFLGAAAGWLDPSAQPRVGPARIFFQPAGRTPSQAMVRRPLLMAQMTPLSGPANPGEVL